MTKHMVGRVPDRRRPTGRALLPVATCGKAYPHTEHMHRAMGDGGDPVPCWCLGWPWCP